MFNISREQALQREAVREADAARPTAEPAGHEPLVLAAMLHGSLIATRRSHTLGLNRLLRSTRSAAREAASSQLELRIKMEVEKVAWAAEAERMRTELSEAKRLEEEATRALSDAMWIGQGDDDDESEIEVGELLIANRLQVRHAYLRTPSPPCTRRNSLSGTSHTCVILVSYFCHTCVILLSNLCHTCVILMSYLCCTCAILVPYVRPTCALLAPYLCHTCAPGGLSQAARVRSDGTQCVARGRAVRFSCRNHRTWIACG